MYKNLICNKINRIVRLQLISIEISVITFGYFYIFKNAKRSEHEGGVATYRGFIVIGLSPLELNLDRQPTTCHPLIACNSMSSIHLVRGLLIFRIPVSLVFHSSALKLFWIIKKYNNTGTYKCNGAFWIPLARPQEYCEQLVIVSEIQVLILLQQLSEPLKGFPDPLRSLSQLELGLGLSLGR